MKTSSILLAAALLLPGLASAEAIKVLSTQATQEAYLELVRFAGIDYVGPLPGNLQRMTMFSTAIHSGAKRADAAKALVKFITAPSAAPVIRKHGLEEAK